MQLFEKIIIQLCFSQYIVYMKKLIAIALVCLTLTVFLPACGTSVDYYAGVSELRTNIYLYEEDEFSFKIYISERETPYASDGIKGNVTPVIELYYTPAVTPDEAEVSLEGLGGEMSYLSVSKSFYLSFTGKDFGKDKVSVTLTTDGKEKTFEAVSVLYDGVITPREALSCVIEYDKNTFENLTENNAFRGEIYIRLLFDQGCFYYIGVCDKQSNVSAYLVNGENGRIIAEKKTGQ